MGHKGKSGDAGADLDSRFRTMMEAMILGITPDEYAEFYSKGLEEWTDDARDTGITAYLAAKGDKLVYVYDFGDDWIFDVSVTAVEPRDGDVAVCTRWKSDLQPMEDTGGIWSYLNMRTAMKEKDSLKPRQKKELAESIGFDSFDELKDCVSGAMFDPEEVNNSLAEI